MQIPRGTFRSLKKAVRLGALIREMEKEKFSGSCSIVTPFHSIDLVLREGRVLLAGCDTLTGEAAWDSVLSLQDEEVDASLSDLSNAQIDLTLEFNSDSKVQLRRAKPGAKPPSSSKEEEHVGPKKVHPGTAHASIPFRENAPSTPVSQSGPTESPSERPSPGTAMRGRNETNPKPEIKGPELASNDDFAVFSRDLEALDSMDLESMSEKMRANYRSMMEKLHLEHLIKKNGG